MISTLQALVRPLVTLSFAGALVYGFVVDKITSSEFIGLAGLAVGFYFQARSNGGAQ